MTAPEVGRGFAQISEVALRSALRLRLGQSVLIEATEQSASLAATLSLAARGLGIRASILLVPSWSLTSLPRGNARYAEATIGKIDEAAARTCDGHVMLAPGTRDLLRRDRLPPSARRAVHARRRAWYRLLSSLRVPSVYILATTVTPDSPRFAAVDYRGWWRRVLAASTADPAKMQRSASRIRRALRVGHELLLTHPNGTRVELGLLGKPPIVDDARVDTRDVEKGRLGTTLPSGYLAVPLDERVAEGHLISNLAPVYRDGHIGHLRLTFRGGRLVRYSMRSGRGYFDRSFRRAGPERDHPGVLTIGLNPAARGLPFAEDLEAGVVTLHLGHNEDFGGRQSGSYRQVALLRGGTLRVDGVPYLRNGNLRTDLRRSTSRKAGP